MTMHLLHTSDLGDLIGQFTFSLTLFYTNPSFVINRKIILVHSVLVFV